MSRILPALKKNTSINQLSLYRNTISDTQAIPLIEWIINSSNISYIDLSCNPLISYEGSKKMDKLLSTCKHKIKFLLPEIEESQLDDPIITKESTVDKNQVKRFTTP